MQWLLVLHCVHVHNVRTYMRVLCLEQRCMTLTIVKLQIPLTVYRDGESGLLLKTIPSDLCIGRCGAVYNEQV